MTDDGWKKLYRVQVNLRDLVGADKYSTLQPLSQMYNNRKTIVIILLFP